MKIRESAGTRMFNFTAAVVLIVLSVLCMLPFVIILSGSFTDNDTIISSGYSILPRDVTLDAYKTIFENPKDMLLAYQVTALVTLIGTVVGLLLIAMTGFVLSRKEFRCRNIISFMIYFTSIFGGGLVPWYYMYAGVLQSKGTLFPIIVPALMSPFLIILMRTFIVSALPDEITEAAIVDGAGNFTIFGRIVLPVITPGLATIGLFLALGYWNDWYRSSLFSTNSSTWTLQYYLYNIINRAEALRSIAAQAGVVITNLPRQSVKLAMAIVVTGPILLLYPFVQKYFVTGITVGAVKG
jgi:putative aldouronate transport system permease protein